MKKTKGDLLFNGCKEIISHLVKEDALTRIMDNAYKRYDELLFENKDEPKVMDAHTKARIYPAISVFEALVKEGFSRKEASDIIYQFYDVSAAKGAKFLQGLLKLPGLYKKVPKFASSMVKKGFGENAGFRFKEYATPKNEMHIDMLVCPYHEICKKYACPEIVKAFCHSDDVAYGHMHPKLSWERSGTLGRGDQLCDFIIKVK